MTLQSVTVRNEPGNSKEQTMHNGASKEKKCPKVNPYCDAIFDQSVTVRNEPGNGKEQTSLGHRVMITWSFSLGPE